MCFFWENKYPCHALSEPCPLSWDALEAIDAVTFDCLINRSLLIFCRTGCTLNLKFTDLKLLGLKLLQKKLHLSSKNRRQAKQKERLEKTVTLIKT